ncbi:MAG: cbb3-type cytochrome oxidase assembly protein CcoS [Flavobacterium sp.]|uniref:cbb3-type cytochrome oxidase assembly protein CcoS n=1 Tax=Flavobacterium sp. TaxID=239 RepID=UPI001208A214|nr:cbb3-type cytochrome oxidase assembly protein CcoS [Flavobacterium sp.]RZJ68687.1 MAG: cbb3-type cytochrome oxidase assembly protein CcoS [Flavobacterium sp.]
MSVIYLLICVSIFVAVCFFAVFVAAVKVGQFEDTYTPSVRMLFDDETKIETKNHDKPE